MHIRSRNILVDAPWRDLPFKSSQKGLRDLLIDILLEMPDVYQLLDKAQQEKCRSKILLRFINIVELSWQFDSRINDWHSRFETFVAGPAYWPKLSTSNSPADDTESGKVFAAAFHFPSFAVAHSMILYWLFLLLIHPLLCGIYKHLENLVRLGLGDMECSCIQKSIPETAGKTMSIPTICLRHFTVDKLPPLGFPTEWARGAVRNICQSAEYLMQENMGEVGPASLLPRLLAVREFLAIVAPGEWPREVSWINDMMRKTQDMGNDISRYL